jgi:hypothetical protein
MCIHSSSSDSSVGSCARCLCRTVVRDHVPTVARRDMGASVDLRDDMAEGLVTREVVLYSVGSCTCGRHGSQR